MSLIAAMAAISCILRSFVFLLSLAAMIRFLDASAGNVEMDEYLEKKAQKALEDSVRSYASNPEEVTTDFNEQVGE